MVFATALFKRRITLLDCPEPPCCVSVDPDPVSLVAADRISKTPVNCALVVTATCVVEDPQFLFHERHRIMKPGLCLVGGFVDRNSSLGQHDQAVEAGSVFYRQATFLSPTEFGD
jgi:hypothetical protein